MALRLKEVIPTTTTRYVGIPMIGRTYIDVQWRDAVSAAAITLETTGANSDVAPTDVAGSAWQWKTEAGVTITGPAATAAGSTKVHVTSLGPCRARIKIVTTAVSDFEIYSESVAL